MDNPEKLATQSTQVEEKHNTICAGHHYAQTNHVSKMYVHSDYIMIYLYTLYSPINLVQPSHFSLKCLYTKPGK